MKLCGRLLFLLPVLFLLGCPPPAQTICSHCVEAAPVASKQNIMRLEIITVRRPDNTDFTMSRVDCGTGYVLFTAKNVLFIPKAVSANSGYSEYNNPWKIEEVDAKSE